MTMFSAVFSKQQSRRGIVLIIAILILLVGALAAIISLTSSRQNIRLTGLAYGKRVTGYNVEEAVNRTLSKIRSNPTYTDDPTKTTMLYAGFNSDVDDVNSLTNCEALYAWPADHSATSPTPPGLVTDGGKLICNFLGTEFKNGYVSVRRDKNFVDADSGNAVAVYLVSSIAKDGKGVVNKMQAVILLPLTIGINASAYKADTNFAPYISSSVQPK